MGDSSHVRRLRVVDSPPKLYGAVASGSDRFDGKYNTGGADGSSHDVRVETPDFGGTALPSRRRFAGVTRHRAEVYRHVESPDHSGVPMKLVYQSLAYREDDEPERYGRYGERLRERLDGVSDADTSIEVRGTPSGAPGHSYRFAYQWGVCGVLANVAALRDDPDVDALVVGNFLDPGLWEAREVLSVPVTGLCESSLLVGCATADRLGILAWNEKQIPLYRDNIRRYGLEERVVHIEDLDIPPEDRLAVFSDESAAETVAASIERAAEACRERGVELAIPGGGIPSVFLIHEDIRRAAGVPLLDPIGTAIGLAETLVELYDRRALETSPVRAFRPPPDDLWAEIRAAMEGGG
jgi:Asp/Glu/hydantoin racemase